jgi:ribosomal protein S18 acetylase RimI-like enzyme
MFKKLLSMLTPGRATAGGDFPASSGDERHLQKDGQMKIRFLNERDVVAYRDLWLRALKESPTAFGSSYETEAGQEIKNLAGRLRHDDVSDNGVMGAFAGGTVLAGILGFNRDSRQKRRHIIVLGGMYVAPEFRGQGCGRILLDGVISHVRRFKEVRRIILAVTAGNVAAASLYKSRGFKSYGVEPDAIRVGDKFYGMEQMGLDIQDAA